MLYGTAVECYLCILCESIFHHKRFYIKDYIFEIFFTLWDRSITVRTCNQSTHRSDCIKYKLHLISLILYRNHFVLVRGFVFLCFSKREVNIVVQLHVLKKKV